ncbi:MAG TPA: hypothetical protein VGA84_07785 [Thermoanaerobaculia bacterium]
MTSERESGFGGRESERELTGNANAPTPDPRLPIPDNRQPTTDNLNWPILYAAVIGELAILVLIFYAFTKAFA